MSESNPGGLLKGAKWAIAGKVLSMLATFSLTFILARALTPSDYGLYFLALNSIVILAGAGTLGQDQVVVRFASVECAAGAPTTVRRVIVVCARIVVVLAAIFAVVFIVATRLLAPFHSQVTGSSFVFLVCALWLFVATIQRQLAESFRGLNDIKRATLFGGVRNSGIVGSLLAASFMAVLWQMGVLNLTISLCVMLATSIIVVAVSAIEMNGHPAFAVGPAVVGGDHGTYLETRKALAEGWPLWIAAMLTTLNAAGGVWLAEIVDSTAHVALFGVAARVVALLVAPMVIVNAVLPPIVARQYATNEIQRMGRLVRAVSAVLLLPLVIVVAGIVIAGKPMLGAVFGSYYRDSYMILLALCLGPVANISTGAWHVVLPMTGGRQEMVTSSAIGLLTLVTVGLVAGSAYGVLGVAAATGISNAVSNTVGMYLVHRRLGIWTFASLGATARRELFRTLRGEPAVANT